MRGLFQILNRLALAGPENSTVDSRCYLRMNDLVKMLYFHVHLACNSSAISAFLSFKFSSYFCDFFFFFLPLSDYLPEKVVFRFLRKFDAVRLKNYTLSNPKISLKKYLYWKFGFEKSQKIFSYEWNKSGFCKIIHNLKTDCKNLQILKISCGKSYN